jgi:hypothetical protein
MIGKGGPLLRPATFYQRLAAYSCDGTRAFGYSYGADYINPASSFAAASAIRQNREQFTLRKRF